MSLAFQRALSQGVASRPSLAPVAASCRSIRRPRAFSGARRPAVVASAAEGEAAPAAPQQQQKRQQRRAPRNVTVQLADIQPGQEYEGTVTKVEAFGAFVNIGAETDGLVHVSQLSDGYVKNVADVVKAGATVKVKVLTLDPTTKRLALTMKGMGNAAPTGRRGGAGTAAAAPAESSFAEDDDEPEDDGFVLEAGDIALDGVVFRVEDGAGDLEGYGEADEYEFAAADADVALAAAVVNTAIEGTVTAVEDFGVIVEWADAAGAKRTGLLHVSELRAPAAAAAAELGEAPAAAAAADADGEEGAGAFADEGEFVGERYVDVGGIDKPSNYYKVGDAIGCYVMAAEGGKVELTQDLASLALDDALDEEGEALDGEEERALARADGEEAALALGDDEGEEGEELAPVAASDAEASIFYGESATASKAAGAPAFIRGKPGAAVAPGAFPSRGYALADAALRVPASANLVDVDDAGDEAELVDFWTDDIGRISGARIAEMGAKIVPAEEGALAVVMREGAGGGDDGEGGEEPGPDALELLGGLGDDDIEALVDAVLAADGAEDEAELPFLARRNPVPL